MTTPWSAAIRRLLAEKHWSRRELARRAGMQPNTLTSMLKHGRHSDTETLCRIAEAFDVQLIELFATDAQATLLRTYRDDEVPVAAAHFYRELEGTVQNLVARELAKTPKKDVERIVNEIVRPAKRERSRPSVKGRKSRTK